MEKENMIKLKAQFDGTAQVWPDSEVAFWFARDLQKALGYDRWENFVKVILKAKISCDASGVARTDHFRDVTKMVTIGSAAKRSITDVMLTRYACYLIAQNGDPRKAEIAFAQSYFAIQTRKQERIEERFHLQERLRARQKLRDSEIELSKNIYERGVDDKGFGRIRSKGDMALFGGKSTQQMKDQWGVAKARPLADFLPTVTITAKNLATEITNFNVQREQLEGERSIATEHVQNNTSVRAILLDRGIQPEALPPEEDLKKMERRLQSEKKKMIRSSELPHPLPPEDLKEDS